MSDAKAALFRPHYEVVHKTHAKDVIAIFAIGNTKPVVL